MNLYKLFEEIKEKVKNSSRYEFENIQDAQRHLEKFDELLAELKSFIERAFRDNNEILAIKGLILLAQNIGCAEDLRTTEKFIACLQDENLLSKKAYTRFYQNLNIGRWE